MLIQHFVPSTVGAGGGGGGGGEVNSRTNRKKNTSLNCNTLIVIQSPGVFQININMDYMTVTCNIA